MHDILMSYKDSIEESITYHRSLHIVYSPRVSHVNYTHRIIKEICLSSRYARKLIISIDLIIYLYLYIEEFEEEGGILYHKVENTIEIIIDN